MSVRISKDQAVVAMILWENFLVAAEKEEESHGDKMAFLTDYTASNARYAMLEMAADTEEVLLLLPENELDRLSADDFVYKAILDCFDYQNGSVPKLKHSREAIAEWLESNFGMSDNPVVSAL